MLHTIRKLLGDKSRQLTLPIALMSLDAVFSIVLYIVLYGRLDSVLFLPW